MKSKTKFRDILAFQFWANGRSKINWVTTVIAGIVFAFLFHTPAGSPERDIAIEALILIAGFGAGAMLVIVLSAPVLFLAALSHYLLRGAIGPKDFIVGDQDFSENDGYKVRSVRWKDIKGLFITPHYIFVKKSLFRYHILPRRDFDSEFEFASYYANLVRLREASHRSK